MFKQSELIKMLSLDDIVKTKDDFLIHQKKNYSNSGFLLINYYIGNIKNDFKTWISPSCNKLDISSTRLTAFNNIVLSFIEKKIRKDNL